MGKGTLSRLPSIRQRRKKDAAVKTWTPPPPPAMVVGGTGEKARGTRLWMRFDRNGATEVVECEKSTIIKRASLPARDLRVLGPLFSHSSNILAREKAIVVNLEVIKAVVTAEEVLLLDPLRPEVLSLIDRLKQQFPASANIVPLDPESGLPFEFQVMEIALEVVCSFLNSSVAALETEAWHVLDELTKNVSTENLEYVRCFKSKLTRLLARVQKVKDEIEHLLNDNQDMADLYLTRKWRKWIQNQEAEGTASNNRSNSMVKEDDVEDLEMLLEAYFIPLEGMCSKILKVRGHIDDTEDYVKIQQSNQRNKLIQLKLTLIIAAFAIAAPTLLVSLLGMNIPIPLYNTNGVFAYFVWSAAALCIVLFMVTLGYARWKKLLGS